MNDQKEPSDGESPIDRRVSLRREDIPKMHIAMRRWDGFFSTTGNTVTLELEYKNEIKELLGTFIGLSQQEVDLVVVAQLPYRFRFMTETGEWRGFAVDEESHVGGEIEQHTHVLLLQFDDNGICRSAVAVGNAVSSYSSEIDTSSLGNGVVSIGEAEPGTPLEEQGY